MAAARRLPGRGLHDHRYVGQSGYTCEVNARDTLRGIENGTSGFFADLGRFIAQPQEGVLISEFVDAGWSSPVARWAHNPKVAGSNPAPATKFLKGLR